MKIKEAKSHIEFYVEIEEEEGEDFDFHHYRTDKNGNHWQVYMGDSWEIIEVNEELRTKFLQYIRKLG